MLPLIACHSPHWNSPLLSHARVIPQFCATSSLALDNWGQKYRQNQLFLKDSPSIFWKIAWLLGKIKNAVSLRFTSLSFSSKKIVLWEDMCLYWLLIVCTMKWALWPVPIYGPDSGGVALTCSSLFLCPALLGIVFHVSLLQEFWDGKGEIKYPASRAFFPAALIVNQMVCW